MSPLRPDSSLILLDEAHCARPFLQTLQAVRRFRAWAHAPHPTPEPGGPNPPHATTDLASGNFWKISDMPALYAISVHVFIMFACGRHRNGRNSRDEARAGSPAPRRQEQAQARACGSLRGNHGQPLRARQRRGRGRAGDRGAFCERYGFVPFPSEPRRLFLPLRTFEQLGLSRASASSSSR